MQSKRQSMPPTGSSSAGAACSRGSLRVWQFHAALAFQILVTGEAGAKE
jgi:hypothetical protein